MKINKYKLASAIICVSIHYFGTTEIIRLWGRPETTLLKVIDVIASLSLWFALACFLAFYVVDPLASLLEDIFSPKH